MKKQETGGGKRRAGQLGAEPAPVAQAPKGRASPRSRSRSPSSATEGCPIVGLGASAGGLEALRQIFSHLPESTGLAFVVIQHLDPGRPSMLSSVLATDTRMAVIEVADGMRAEPNRVHVIPPAADICVKRGVFSLVPRRQTGKLHLPIDSFFHSLAEDQAGRAIGVVLSGLGSDGQQGLRAIKDAGGITFAQEPDSAQFRSMPDSAIAAGAVDFRLPPKEIAKEIIRLSQHSYLTRAEAIEAGSGKQEPPEGAHLASVLSTVRDHAQLDFAGYKRPTVLRRIARRMALRHVATIGDYAETLRGDPEEAKELAQDILIHVTSFFRDPAAFEVLKAQVFPALLAKKEAGAPIRIWVAGCSSGEEAYSIIIGLLEFLSEQGRELPIKLFGTDLSGRAVDTARAAIYPAAKLQGVSPERLARFFDPVEGGYCVNKRVRDCCVFVKHDLTRDPPFVRLDLISCRNVLIYLDSELQRRVMPLLHHCLNLPGYLFLGRSEAVTGYSDLFAPLDKGGRIYQKTGDGRRMAYPLAVGRAAEARLSTQAPPERRTPAREAERQADHYLLARYAPPGVVVNTRLEVVQYRGRTGAYLESPPGQPQLNLLRDGARRPGRPAARSGRDREESR